MTSFGSVQPANEPDDIAIVAAMARGKAEALGELYNRYAPIMLPLAERITGTPATAEDVVHDVFLEAWRHAADYDPARGSVRAWLLLRTRSRSLDLRKSAAFSRSVPIGDDTWIAELVASADDCLGGPDQAKMRGALSALPREQREVLLLGYFEGLSSSEIAARIGIPVGTVKSRVAAALGSLRETFAVPQGEK
ncbi:MAG TPA: sigma-70 family RNA polymerase sigma factor [Polyangiaceae bacterium]